MSLRSSAQRKVFVTAAASLGLLSTALLLGVWLKAARRAQTDPVSFLRYPITRLKTFQVGDRTTANLAELNFNEDGTFLYAAVDHIAKALEDTSTHKIGKQLSINALAVSDDSLLTDEITRINSNPVHQKFVLVDREIRLSTSQQQHRFITTGDGNGAVATLNLWARDTASYPDGSMPMRLVKKLTFENFAISQAEMSLDGDFVAIALQNDTTSILGIVDAFTGEMTHKRAVNSPITAIAFSPNHKTLVTAHENRTLYLRETTTGKALREYSYTELSPPRDQRPAKIAFSNDGTLLAFGDSAGIQLWNVDSGEQQGTFTLEDDAGNNIWMGTNSLAISPDSRWIVSDADHTNKLYIWDIRTGKLQRILRTESVEAAFSPNGQLLASGDRYGEVSVWQFPARL